MNYPGNPVFPTSIPLLADQSVPSGAAIDTSLEPLRDADLWLRAMLLTLEDEIDLLTSQTIVAPAGTVAAFLDWSGGGAGGGYGVPGSEAIGNTITCGGGGGGGAVRRHCIVPIIGGGSYAFVRGDGGDPGLVGGDSTFTRVTGSLLLAVARGGAPGCFGGSALAYVDFNGNNQTPQYVFARGGAPVRRQAAIGGTAYDDFGPEASMSANLHHNATHHAGGFGVSDNFSNLIKSQRLSTGNYSPDGYIGGIGGTAGATAAAGILRGGGPGGGGGAGAFGGGGDGGNGSNAVASGDSLPGSNGQSALANTGGGGGGGGSSGSVSSSHTAGAGGTPGSGGSGRCRIRWIRRGGV